MQPVEVTSGDSPIVLGVPHAGTYVPPEIWADLNETGHKLADTDWHVDRLYSGLLPGATMVKANFHRYVIDANRDPAGVSLYPGQNTTTLCPTTDFDGRPIYRDGREPDEAEIEARRLAWHAPYHAALKAELERVREKHGIAILYDCHSIRSVVPYLFEGTLPDFNTGTNGGTTCAPELEKAVVDVTAKARGYTSILNGRFKGGWTTRHYGQQQTGIHAIQMELAQSTHLVSEDTPFAYDEAKAERLRVHLGAILQSLAELGVKR
ncbi:N-formylglutamate deformylase [Roseibium denhamense]|uniref:Formiminoglutamase n=1 Tax=Roseibium denhamense TaxID=76305 RepID=A0ABY1P6H3_9HYPH|nr:N-formylglutamate deformylase [Roseibium denhamense]MTI07189.1 N-formylglutamate deformylase [Roseibium denhamense]SMP26709.1 formiminoglutamase [Roseibium denhamense]